MNDQEQVDGFCVCDDGTPAPDCGIRAHRGAGRAARRKDAAPVGEQEQVEALVTRQDIEGDLDLIIDEGHTVVVYDDWDAECVEDCTACAAGRVLAALPSLGFTQQRTVSSAEEDQREGVRRVMRAALHPQVRDQHDDLLTALAAAVVDAGWRAEDVTPTTRRARHVGGAS